MGTGLGDRAQASHGKPCRASLLPQNGCTRKAVLSYTLEALGCRRTRTRTLEAFVPQCTRTLEAACLSVPVPLKLHASVYPYP